MTNKKKGLLLTLALASTFVLASCNDISALPPFYEGPLVVNEDGEKTAVYQNLVGLLFDSLVDSSDSAKKVLNEMMYIIAVDQLGDYQEVKELALLDKDSERVKDFVKTHESVYKNENDDESDKVANEFARIVHFAETMDYRIKEVFHNAATGGSYSYRSKFDEEKYAVNLAKDLYLIDGVFEPGVNWHVDVLIDPSVDVEDIGDYIHLERYNDYINRGVLPNLYRERLVEQFLLDSNYSTLGRTYARKVEYIKISKNDNYPSAAKSLINAFVDKYILANDAPNEVDLEILANAWRGINLDADALSLLDEAFSKKAVTDVDVLTYLGDATDYYPETQFGAIVKDYLKITDDRFTNNKSIESDFTSNNSYTKQVGLEIKANNLRLEDYTSDGWYVKSGGLSELPEEIRSRLFNINVANQVDFTDPESGVPEEPKDTHDYESGNYVRLINSNYYLTPAVSEQATDSRKDNFVIYDISSSTYYIIKVLEAVSTSKLSYLSANNYQKIREDESATFIEEVAKEVTHVLSAKDSYINNANEHYIELYNFKYHDTTIYDYFVENFPDLFED